MQKSISQLTTLRNLKMGYSSRRHWVALLLLSHNNKKLKGLVHPKKKILSVFTHPHVIQDVHVFLSSVEKKLVHSKKCWVVLTQCWVKYGQTRNVGLKI